jgi:putative glutamine amidotransferase
MNSSPRIGITTYGVNADGRFTLPARYVEAVRRAGGIPVLIAPGEPRLAELSEMLDAIVLTGGADIDPALYGEEPHPETYGIDSARDETDLSLARRAVETRTPALCICRGIQVLNVALGGTLIQHLPDVVGERVPHKKTGGYVPHAVRVERGSRLAEILRATDSSPASSHHQAIAKVGTGLEVVARAPDGTIEAVEMREHPFLVGVQWHPEHTAGEDEAQQRLFDELVRAARQARERRGSPGGAVTRGRA